jgi:ligand-binding sensor domain-containing protein
MRILSILFLIAASTGIGHAQSVYWKSSSSPATAPIVGFVRQSSGTWFSAAKDGMVLKSTNDGKSWTIASTELSSANCISMDVLNQSTAYIGTNTGIWKSATGSNFTRTTSSPSNTRIQALHILSNNLIECGTSSGVFLSSDRGASWEVNNDELLDKNVQACGSSGTSYIYAGTPTGLFVGSNGGTSWMTTDNLGSVNVKCFRAHGNTGSVYVGSTNGLYRSNNWGVNWTKVLTTTATIQSIIRSTDAMLAGSTRGVYYSADKGTAWRLASGGMEDSNVTAVFVTSDNHGLIGTATGEIYRSIQTLSGFLGIEEDRVIPTGFDLYPNPANTILHVDLGGDNYSTVTIHDMLGNVVVNKEFSPAEQCDIDVHTLSAGCYTVSVGSQKSMITRNLLIKR